MKKTGIPDSYLRAIFEQAEREYPNECCGIILGRTETLDKLTRLKPCRNVQDEYHKKDPENFPRTAAHAYFIEPKELLLIQKETRHYGECMRVIYHSHVDAAAYFSAEDERMAVSSGEPVYPGVDYLVVSVMAGKTEDSRLYSWDSAKRKFIS